MAEHALTFDFPLLDDLLLLNDEDVTPALASVRPLLALSVGPLVEYVLHRACAGGNYPPAQKLTNSPLAEQVDREVQKGGRFDLTRTSLEPLPCELSPLPSGSDTAPLLWRAFKHRLANAAISAGFDKLTAKGLAGAFGELHNNAQDHSNSPDTVITGYRWHAGEFEMVVADAGVGVLASLRSHPDYQHLREHGEALRTAVSPGETRYGRGSGHGTGFDTVFRNMASLQGALRFRSGDHSLELSGISPSLINSKLQQRQHFQGFAVSITCRPL